MHTQCVLSLSTILSLEYPGTHSAVFQIWHYYLHVHLMCEITRDIIAKLLTMKCWLRKFQQLLQHWKKSIPLSWIIWFWTTWILSAPARIHYKQPIPLDSWINWLAVWSNFTETCRIYRSSYHSQWFWLKNNYHWIPMFGYILMLKINIHANETREYYLLRDFYNEKNYISTQVSQFIKWQ